MGALTKAELDATTAAWRAHCEQKGFPVNIIPNENNTSKAAPTPNAALIKAIMAGIASVLHEHISQEIAKATAPLLARIEELERKGYVGVWKSGREYSPQSEVTHDGARWLAHKRTSDKPGASADWSLIEKATTSHARNGSAGPTARPRPP